MRYVLSVLFVIEGLDVMVILQMIDKYWFQHSNFSFYMFYIAFMYFQTIFCAVWVDIKQGGGQISNVKSACTKYACTMSFDGSPKGKTDHGQSSKILFKQKWGIPKV